MLRFLNFLVVFSWISCTPDQNKHEKVSFISEVDFQPHFKCKSLPNEEPPSFEVFLNTPKPYLLARINQCAIIKATEYAQYHIPKKAIQACGGWWAGLGNYFYMIKNQKNRYQIFRGQMYEEKENNSYDYKLVASISEKGVLTEELQLPDLEGIYALGGHQTSWFMIVAQKDDAYNVQFCEVDGMLPPDDYIYKNLEKFNIQQLKKFTIDSYDLSFDSDLGKGQFVLNEGIYEAIFYQKTTLSGETLKLVLKSKK